MIKNRLRDIMAETGYSVRQLAQATGLSPTTIQKLAGDEREAPSAETLNRLCSFFGVQPQTIIYHED